MPKTKKQRTSRVLLGLNVGNGIFKMHAEGARCSVCNIVLRSATKYSLEQHLSTPKHKVNANRHMPQQILDEYHSTLNMTEFEEDIVKTFITADIPLHKLNSKYLQSLFEKYTKQKLPSSFKAHTKYLPKIYSDKIDEIAVHFHRKKIWVSNIPHYIFFFSVQPKIGDDFK